MLLLLQKHLYGNAAGVIDACNYLGNENHFKIAIKKLTEAYGNRCYCKKSDLSKLIGLALKKLLA